jgi:hypothetical protein
MGKAVGTKGPLLAGKSLTQLLFRRLKWRCEDNIKSDLRDIG